MADRVLRGVVVGVGFGGELVESAHKCAHFKLAGGYDLDGEALGKFAERFGVRGYHSYEEVLSDGEIEGVVVATPNDTHRALVEQAAAAGTHVFVEKPIANTVADGRAIIAACEKAGVGLTVGHLARRSSLSRTAKGVIESGKLGQVVLVETNGSHAGGLYLTKDQWRWHRDKCPGGPVMQLSVHAIDTLQYLFGPVKSVRAKLSRLATPAEIDDTAVMGLEFESGVLGYAGTAYTIPDTWYLTVYGTGGILSVGRGSDGMTLRDASGRVERLVKITETDPRAEELDDFAVSAMTGGRAETGGEEGMRALAVVLAAIRSSEEGREVTTSEVLGG